MIIIINTKIINMGKVADIEVVDPEVVTGGKPTYDPKKRYTWTPDTVFTLTGKEFGLWINSTRAKLMSKSAIDFEFKITEECNNVIENIMARGVAEGIVIEVPETPEPIKTEQNEAGNP